MYEGQPPATRVAINRFDSLDAVKVGRNSDKFKEARKVGDKTQSSAPSPLRAFLNSAVCSHLSLFQRREDCQLVTLGAYARRR